MEKILCCLNALQSDKRKLTQKGRTAPYIINCGKCIEGYITQEVCQATCSKIFVPAKTRAWGF